MQSKSFNEILEELNQKKEDLSKIENDKKGFFQKVINLITPYKRTILKLIEEKMK